MGPRLVGLLPSKLSLTTVGAFMLPSPTPMLGPDTRASSKLKTGLKATLFKGQGRIYWLRPEFLVNSFENKRVSQDPTF